MTTEATETNEAHRDGEAPNFWKLRDAFRARVFAPREVRFPGEETPMRVRLLSEVDLDRCRIAAIEHVKKHRVDTVVDRDEVLERERVRQMLFHAFITAQDDAKSGEQVRFFATPAELRDTLDSATVDRLYEIYLDHQAQVADASVPADEELDKAIDLSLTGGEAAAALLVQRLDARALRALFLRLLDRFRQAREAGNV